MGFVIMLMSVGEKNGKIFLHLTKQYTKHLTHLKKDVPKGWITMSKAVLLGHLHTHSDACQFS